MERWSTLYGVFMVWFMARSVISATGPPWISERYNPRKIVRVGRTVRLLCPVLADPPPIIQWSKDKQAIHTGWTRFKMQSNVLRIKEVETADSGVYVCKATNGFGSRNVNYTLYVLEANQTVPHFPVDGNSADRSGTPPRFIEAAKMRKRHIQRPVGSSVRLKCKSSGKPSPSVIWMKDGEPIPDVSRNSQKRAKWTLRLRKLRVEDSGSYMCKVYNRAGAINFTYTLEVIGKTRTKPVLLPPHPVNTTVNYGQMASFQCKVKSDVQPHIQWLKRIEDQKELVKLANTTINVNGQQFVVLKPNKVWARSDGSFINKLTLQRATEKDSGMYICLGANSMGYSFRSAFLTVLQPDQGITGTEIRLDEQIQEGPSKLALIIAIPSAAMVVVAAVAIYLFQRNKKCNNPRTIQKQKPYINGYQDRDLVTPLQHQQYVPNKERMYRNNTPDLHSHSEFSNCPRLYPPELRPQTYTDSLIHSDVQSDVSTRVHSDLHSELSSVHTRLAHSDMYSDISSLPRIHQNPMDMHANLLARLHQQQKDGSARTPTPSESSSVSRMHQHMHYHGCS